MLTNTEYLDSSSLSAAISYASKKELDSFAKRRNILSIRKILYIKNDKFILQHPLRELFFKSRYLIKIRKGGLDSDCALKKKKLLTPPHVFTN